MNVMKQRCSTCIFRIGNLMDLQEGRVDDMVDTCRREDSFIVCHQTLGLGNYGSEDDDGWGSDVTRSQAVCRGYYDQHGAGQLGRISERLGLLNTNYEIPEEELQ